MTPVIILSLLCASLISAIEDRGTKSRTLFQHEPVGYWANPYWPVPHYTKLTFPNQPDEAVRYPQVNVNRFADQSAPKPPVSAVINGTPVPRGVIPNMAILSYDGSHYCGGTLITPHHVLTAAHCLEWITPLLLAKIRVYLNTTSLVPLDSGTVVREVSRVVIHPHYRAISSTAFSVHDVGILFLDYAVPGLRSMALAANTSETFQQRPATVYGFGITQTYDPASSSALPPTSNILLSGSLRVLANQQCAQLWSQPGLSAEHYICVDGDQDACNGDSGGPLVINATQIGVVSFGRAGCDPNFPVIYARTSFYSAWIKRALL